MSFKKPFRATPVRLGQYQQELERRRSFTTISKIIVSALVVGVGAGGAMALYESGGLTTVAVAGRQVAADIGFVRQTMPKLGDYWSGCNDARAAGVTPLHFGEPGYRPEMDGDGDGIACEPYHGG